MELLGALLKAIWPDAENVENPSIFLVFGALAAVGGVLEASRKHLGASWSVLEAS